MKMIKNKKALVTLAVMTVMVVLLSVKPVAAKEKLYMIEKLESGSVEIFNYKWNWETGYKPKGKVKNMVINDKTKFFILPEDAALGVDYVPEKASFDTMQKEVDSYKSEGWHMFATVKFKKINGKKTVVSITEELQDW